MRPVAIVVCALLLAGCAATPRVPQGIRYLRATDSQNRQATRVIRHLLAGTGSVDSGLVRSGLLVGPGLWRAIGSGYAFGECLVAPASFQTPFDRGRHDSLAGAYITSCQPASDLVRRVLDGKRPKRARVRKLSRKELVLHWGMFPWDIAEPVFVAETSGRRILFSFGLIGDRLFLRAIDEIETHRELGYPVDSR